jgi:riboflavin transporter 2
MSSLKIRIPKLLTYTLICIFGIGSWIAVNGIWAEIPVLLSSTPECYHLPAVLVVIIQIANVGILLYVLMKYIFRRYKLQAYTAHLEIGMILILVVIGILSCILLAIFWNQTLVVFGGVHSISLFILTFTLALVDCTSSVLFIPFMKHFPSEYLSALYVGEGLSGLLPSFFAFTQGPVNNSISCSYNYTGHQELGIRFSPNVFFIFLGGMMLLSGMAFIALITFPAVRKHMVSGLWKKYDNIQGENSHEHYNEPANSKLDCDVPFEGTKVQQNKPNLSIANVWEIFWSDAALYICLSVLSFLTNGAISSISSFAFRLYGNSIYHLSINLALIATPLMSFIFSVFPSKSKVTAIVTTVIICILGIYVIVMAQTPAHTFQESTFAKVLMVSGMLMNACTASRLVLYHSL